MACYMMKARTAKKSWFSFTIEDIPTVVNDKQIALMARPKSPLLRTDDIRRGDMESGLFEGDVIRAEDDVWLICYERGFYAINNDYVVRYIYTFKEFEVIGDYTNKLVNVSINFRNKQLFKYHDKIFRLNDIVGIYEDKLLLRSTPEPIDPTEVNQECCISNKGSRLYLGDLVDGVPCEMRGGRIVVPTDNGYLDLSTGGVLDGYHTADSNRE